MSPASPPVFRQWFVAWLVLLAIALGGLCEWWALGRPVALPDAPSARIACVSYAPFRRPGETPLDPQAKVSPERIDADLQALSKRFDCVRTYSQGQGLDAVPEIAGRHGMTVLLGLWLGRDAAANEHEVAAGIALANRHPQVVRGVIVGNEVLLRGELSPERLAAYLRQVRDAVEVPVTYADVWEFWLRHPELSDAVDYVTIHILPYWEDKPVAPEHAVEHVAAVYRRVQQAFPGRRVMIGETGWPSAGRPRQTARASVVEEARYLRGFLRYAATVDMPYNVIEAFDQPWKRELEGTVGGYWGIFDGHAKPKFAMQGPVVEVPHWQRGWWAAAAGAGLFLLVGGWRRRWRGRLALLLAGVASGSALAWQARQMFYACRDAGEWTVSIAACVLALFTALRLAGWIAARLEGAAVPRLPSWLHPGWLFGLAYYGLLLVADGRYRDFPLGLFLLPCVGFALVGWLRGREALPPPSVEQRFLSVVLPLLGVAVLVQEAGLTPAAWSWLGLNLLLAWPVWRDWRLQAQQPQAADQHRQRA